MSGRAASVRKMLLFMVLNKHFLFRLKVEQTGGDDAGVS
jgi:hypothetical protein